MHGSESIFLFEFGKGIYIERILRNFKELFRLYYDCVELEFD